MRHKTSRVWPVGTDKWMSSLLCGAGCGATHLTIFRCVWAIFTKAEKPLSVWGRLHRTLPFIFIDYVDPDFNANHKRSAKPGRMKYKNSLLLGWGTVLQERLAGVLNQVLLQLIIYFFCIGMLTYSRGYSFHLKSSHLVLRRFERGRLLKSTFPSTKNSRESEPPPPPPPTCTATSCECTEFPSFNSFHSVFEQMICGNGESTIRSRR